MPRSLAVTYYWLCTRCGLQHIIPALASNTQPAPCEYCGGAMVTQVIPSLIAGPVETARRDRP